MWIHAVEFGTIEAIEAFRQQYWREFLFDYIECVSTEGDSLEPLVESQWTYRASFLSERPLTEIERGEAQTSPGLVRLESYEESK